MCGGSLINNQWVYGLNLMKKITKNNFILIFINLKLITAAHCVDET